MDNADWLRLLRAKTKRRELRLPRDLAFSGPPDRLTLTLGAPAVVGNMQEDAAAFEAWALAFLANGCAEHVEIALSEEAIPERVSCRRHFERLVYRLHRFADLLPKEVSVRVPATVQAEILTHPDLVLNQPVQSRLRGAGKNAARLSRLAHASATAPSEADLEIALEASVELLRDFSLEKVMRQWPVGVFRDRVARDSYVFTGGKSAVDLIGVRGETLVLFELKKAGNRKAGILSELLFYASVMRDALGDTARFRFEDKPPVPGCKVGREDITRCNRIEAVLLAPAFHPIITPELLGYLNVALVERWSKVPVHFRMSHLSHGDGPVFTFAHDDVMA